ncbi:hypothetical protein [Sphingomonas swuensis]
MIMIPLMLALQVAATPPDIEIKATVRARSLTIEKAGRAEVRVSAGDRNVVDIQGPAPNGRKQIRNPAYTVDIRAHVVEPGAAPAAQPE